MLLVTPPDPFFFPGSPGLSPGEPPKTEVHFPDFSHDFKLLGLDVVWHVEKLFGRAGARPLGVHRIEGPVSLTDAIQHPRFVWIFPALNDDDIARRNYCRFAYQLSHELGLYYFDAHRSNDLIETLCDCVQRETLWSLDRPHFKEYWNLRTEARTGKLKRQAQVARTSPRLPWPQLIGLAARTHPSVQEDPRFREDLPTDLSGLPEKTRTILEAVR